MDKVYWFSVLLSWTSLLTMGFSGSGGPSLAKDIEMAIDGRSTNFNIDNIYNTDNGKSIAAIATKQSNSCGTNFVSPVGDARGGDGTIYRRYLDFRRGREAINSAACGREYWISPTSNHRNYGVRFVYLVNGGGQRVAEALYYEAGDGSLRIFRNADEARLPNPFAGDLGISNRVSTVPPNPPSPPPQPRRPNQQNTPQPTPRNTPPASNNSSPAGDTQAQIINAHNRWRSQVNSPPLSWSNDLARVAQDWADQLSRSGSISHRPNSQYGENIYWASGAGFSGTDAVNSWGSEIRYFRNGNFPDVSTTGNWMDVGHYTQVISTASTQVGCGSARTGNQVIWVCNYNPPGNRIGQNPLSR